MTADSVGHGRIPHGRHRGTVSIVPFRGSGDIPTRTQRAMSSVEGIVVTGKAHPRQINERCSDDGDACRWFFRAGGTCSVLHGQHGTRCAWVMSPPRASLRSTSVTASPVPGVPLPRRRVGGSVFNHVRDCCGLFRISAGNLCPGRKARR